MMKTTPGVALALDNRTALEVVDDTYRIITSKPTAKARKVYWKRGEYIVEEIAPSESFTPLKALTQK